ncbi:MAG: glycoside hydrolase family 3 N-terminal domain-containing protein [Gemmatimonadota bacterium]
MSDAASLCIAAIRWDAARGYGDARPLIDAALRMGVGGFTLYGGTADAVRALTRDLQQRSRTPLLIGADMERGAGQQFDGSTGLPPAAAIASLRDRDAVRRAARHTAREARTMGVNWNYAPVADLDVEPANPVMNTRGFGAQPSEVGDYVAEWIDACQSEGVLACAKHFPGHGRTLESSSVTLPVVSTPHSVLMQDDLLPFKSAIDAGVGSIMTAHVAYPALDPGGMPATLSREILTWVLRQRCEYENLIVGDSINLPAVTQGIDEGEAAVRAILAGCDMVLAPGDLVKTVQALETAVTEGRIERDRLRLSLRRRLKWAQWVSPPNDYRRPSGTDVLWCAGLADRVLQVVRPLARGIRAPLEICSFDSDAHGDLRSARLMFLNTLRQLSVDARVADRADGPSRGTVVITAFGEPVQGRGSMEVAPVVRDGVMQLYADARAAGRDAMIIWFGHPRLASAFGDEAPLLCAWSGDACMQSAAARWLAKQRG